MPVTSSPLNSFLTNAQSWDCPFSSHPFDEALIIFQETIHMFFHLIKLFWLSKPALCLHLNHYKHHTMTGYLCICLLFIQNCELMPETMAFSSLFPWHISLCLSTTEEAQAQGTRYTRTQQVHQPGRWEGGQKGNEPTECWRMRTEPGQQGNDLPRRGTSGCKAQGVRVSLAFQRKTWGSETVPARLDQPLPPDPSPTVSLWSALRWGRETITRGAADKHPSGKMPAVWNLKHLWRVSITLDTYTPSPHNSQVRQAEEPKGSSRTTSALCQNLSPTAATSAGGSGRVINFPWRSL